MKTFPHAILLFASMLHMGCATAKIESVVDKSFSQKISEVDLVTDGPSKSLSEKFSKFLSDKLTEIKITNDYQVVSLSGPKKLSLEPDSQPSPLITIISNSKKPLILISNMTRVHTVDHTASKIEMEVTIFSKAHNKFIWKSNVTTSDGVAGPGTETMLLNDIVEKLILSLRNDGLL